MTTMGGIYVAVRMGIVACDRPPARNFVFGVTDSQEIGLKRNERGCKWS
jgi:hypothetical protein